MPPVSGTVWEIDGFGKCARLTQRHRSDIIAATHGNAPRMPFRALPGADFPYDFNNPNHPSHHGKHVPNGQAGA